MSHLGIVSQTGHADFVEFLSKETALAEQRIAERFWSTAYSEYDEWHIIQIIYRYFLIIMSQLLHNITKGKYIHFLVVSNSNIC